MKKAISIFLALLLCITPLCSLGAAAAVSLPNGVTRTQVSEALPKIQTLTEKMLEQNDIDLSAMIYGMLFSDSTVNSLLKTIYASDSSQDTSQTLSTLGIDVSPAAVATGLSNYPEISAALSGCASWEEASALIDGFRWNITTKQQFADALSSMLSPFNELLYTILCGGRYSINVLLSIKGENGYQNSIVPMLTNIGCPSVMTQEAFTASADENKSNIMKNLVNMLFAAIDNILAQPVEGMCKYLPAIAYLLDSGAITEAITNLISPLSVRIGIISFTGLDALMENLSVMQDSEGLTSMFENMDMSALTGEEMKLNLPEIDLSELASCGSLNEKGVFVADEELAFVWLLEFIVEVFKLNSDEMMSLMGSDMAVSGETSAMLNDFLAKSNSELVKLIIDLLTLKSEESVNNYQWTYPAITPVEVTYTANLTKENYAKMLDEIDEVINQFAYEFGGGATLSQILQSSIYSNSLVSTLVKSIYSLLAGEDMAMLTSLLGVDASPAGVADAIQSDFPSVAANLRKLSSWDALNEQSFFWGFSNGSKEGFTKAVTAALRPFFPMLRMLLAGGKMNILDVIDIYGSNGYNTAVIPLLEALGCDSSLIKNYSQYVSSSSTDSVLTDILTPLTALFDRLIERPIYTIVEILPNLMYFMENDGLTVCMENLLYPVNVLLEKLGMSDMLSSDMLDMGSFDMSSMMSSLNMGDMGISLDSVDFAQFMNLGTPVTRTSKATVNGYLTQYTYVESDGPAVLITLLRTLLDSMDANALSSVMGGDMMADNPMFATYAQNMMNELAAMTTDESIEWFYDLLFAETPTVEIPSQDAEQQIPTIIYTPEEKTDMSTIIVIIAVAVIVLVVGIIVIIAKVDFSERKQKKKRKKERKAQEKATLKQAKETVKQQVKAEKQAEKNALKKEKLSKEEKELLQHKKVVAYQEKESLKQDAAVEKRMERAVSSQPKQLEREAKKLDARKEKAAKQAIKNARKADKYYMKALKNNNREGKK